MTQRPSGARRLRSLGAAAALAGSVLCGCPGEASIRDKGWREAIECIEAHRSHKDCGDSPRSDAPYASGWGRAIDCMEQERNLAACREPQRAE